MTTVENLPEALATAHAELRTMDEQIAAMKAERDAYIVEHQAIYKKEREMADAIKALQNKAGALRLILFPKIR